MIDFEQWLADLQALITAGCGIDVTDPNKFHNIFVDAMDRDGLLDNMPLLTIEIEEMRQAVVDLPNGYHVEVDFKFVIYTYDFTSRRTAATKRNNLLRSLQNVLRATANTRFSAGVDGSQLVGSTTFGRGTDPKGEGHITSAMTRLTATGYVTQN